MKSRYDTAAEIIAVGLGFLQNRGGAGATAARLYEILDDLDPDGGKKDGEEPPTTQEYRDSVHGDLTEDGKPAALGDKVPDGPAVMMFGKHKGQLVDRVAKDAPQYLEWALNDAGRPDSERVAFRRALDKAGRTVF